VKDYNTGLQPAPLLQTPHLLHGKDSSEIPEIKILHFHLNYGSGEYPKQQVFKQNLQLVQIWIIYSFTGIITQFINFFYSLWPPCVHGWL
jgi:hypothetical protein